MQEKKLTIPHKEKYIISKIKTAYDIKDNISMLNEYIKLSKHYFEKAIELYTISAFNSTILILQSLQISYHCLNMLGFYLPLETKLLTKKIELNIHNIKQFYFSLLNCDSNHIESKLQEFADNICSKLESLRAKTNVLISQFEVSKDINIIKQNCKLIAEEYCGYIAELHKKVEEQFKPPPCDYTICAYGSTSSEIISGYSDLDYYILVEYQSPDVIKYFRELSTLVAICVLNIRESTLRDLLIPSLSWLHYDFNHIFRNGFRIDRNFFNKTKILINDQAYSQYGLIKTANEMLELKNALSSSTTPYKLHQIHGFKEARYISGSRKIYKYYIKSMVTNNFKFNSDDLIELLLYDYQNGLFRLPMKSQYIIKHELLKPIVYFIRFLGKYYNIGMCSTWDILDLLGLEFINKINFDIIAEQLSMTIWLRFMVYDYYNMQKENLHLITKDDENIKNSYGCSNLQFIFKHYILCNSLNGIVENILKDLNYLNSRRLIRSSIVEPAKYMYTEIFNFCLSDDRLKRDYQYLSRFRTNSLYLFMIEDILTSQFFTELKFDISNSDDVNMIEKLLAVITALASYLTQFGSAQTAAKLINEATLIFKEVKSQLVKKGEASLISSLTLLEFSQLLCTVNNKLPTLYAIILCSKARLYFHMNDYITKKESIEIFKLALQLRKKIETNADLFNDQYNINKMDSLLLLRTGLFAHGKFTKQKGILSKTLSHYSKISTIKDSINLAECSAHMAEIECRLASISSDLERNMYLDSARVRLEKILRQVDISNVANYAKYLNQLAWVENYSNNHSKAKLLFGKSLEHTQSKFDKKSHAKLDAYIGLAYVADTQNDINSYLNLADVILSKCSLPNEHPLNVKRHELRNARTNPVCARL